jgi:hypothetical protein
MPAHAAPVAPLPGLKELWAETTGSPEVLIAVLDGPADLSHPCFAGASLRSLGEDSGAGGGTYTTGAITEDCEVTASFTPQAARNGMTWGTALYNSDLDITRVHCCGQPAPEGGGTCCNAYQGETSCSKALPVLCVKVDGRTRPPYAMSACSTCAMEDEYYNGWAEGSIGLTAPAQGNAFATLADVNAYCAAQLGEGYQVAEHHTGRYVFGMDENNFYGDTWPQSTYAGGWGFYGPGQLTATSRFWVDINDQNANCWGRSSGYTVTPSAGTGGSISPSTPQTVNNGETTSFTVTPQTGYKINKVEGCGGTLSGSTYTTGAITEDCAVTASFKKLRKYLVISLAGRHGSIVPRKRQRVLEGTVVTFTVTPKAGYIIKSVSGCGGTLSGSTYTTAPVTRSCAVRASFKNALKARRDRVRS